MIARTENKERERKREDKKKQRFVRVARKCRAREKKANSNCCNAARIRYAQIGPENDSNIFRFTKQQQQITDKTAYTIQIKYTEHHALRQ